MSSPPHLLLSHAAVRLDAFKKAIGKDVDTEQSVPEHNISEVVLAYLSSGYSYLTTEGTKQSSSKNSRLAAHLSQALPTAQRLQRVSVRKGIPEVHLWPLVAEVVASLAKCARSLTPACMQVINFVATCSLSMISPLDSNILCRADNSKGW